MIRDLTETAIGRVKAEQTEAVEEKARESTEERLLDCIFPVPRSLQRRPRLQDDEALDEPDEEDDDGVLQLPFDLGPDVGAEAEEAQREGARTLSQNQRKI